MTTIRTHKCRIRDERKQIEGEYKLFYTLLVYYIYISTEESHTVCDLRCNIGDGHTHIHIIYIYIYELRNMPYNNHCFIQ